jgi:rSAM-associated Gly-rich repeat protein
LKITNNTGFVSFLLALSALNIPVANATANQPTIAERLNRINNTIKEQEAQSPKTSDLKNTLIAGGWGNGVGGGFVNRGGGGWRDGGGFYNRGGGGFANRSGGGGFLNR